ncbi:MAG: hypothetical protein AABZ15_05970 [Nitrospirota bacterium]
MLDTEETRAAQAAGASEEEIPLFLHDPSSKVVLALFENRNLTEEHVLIIANRKNLTPQVLNTLSRDARWSESYRVRLALAKNPKTPLFAALSVARYLRLFDLADLARNHLLPVIYRKKLEAIVIEKIPTLALGVKKTLARVAAGEILIALIKDGYPDVIKLCLGNPHLVEAHLYKVISHKMTTPGTIRTIAENRNWTFRYHIKFALVRNEHTPLARIALFLIDLKTGDLKDLYRDPHLPPGVRPFIHRELLERGEDPERLSGPDEEVLFVIDEHEIEDIETEMRTYCGGDGQQGETDDDDREQDLPGTQP